MIRKISLTTPPIYSIIFLLLFASTASPAQNDCPKVTGLNVSSIGDNSATLEWNTDEAHTKYDVDVMHGSGTPNFKYSTSTSSGEATVDGLQPGSKYRFRVKAKCDKGSGGSSKWTEFTTTGEKPEGEEDYGKGGGKCPEVDDLSVSEVSDTGATLSWSGSESHVSFKIDIMHAPQNAPYKWSVTTDEESIVLDELSPGREYRFRVMASCDKGKNNSGWEYFSTTGEDTIGHGRCPKASNLAVINVEDSSVALTWLGNPENVSYQVDVKQKEHTPQFSLSEIVDTPYLELEGLEPGGNYKFRVKASCTRNSAGSSSWINFVTTGGDSTFNQCPKPRNLSVLEASDSSALLTWVARDSAVSFDLSIKSFEGTPSYRFDTTLVDTFYLVTDLVADGNYHFRVVANCTDSTSSGSSDWSKFRTLRDTTGGSSGEAHEEEPDPLSSVEAQQVQTFPNPVENELNVVLPLEDLGSLTFIMMSDLNGRVVFERRFDEVPSQANMPIPVDGLIPGIYKLSINSIGFSESKTILIQSR